MATYTPLQSIKLTSAATSITFSTIDQTYTDLVVKTNGFNSTLLGVQLRFNGDTNGNYSETVFLGNGTSATASKGSAVTFLNHGYTDTTIGVNISTIFNYASTVMNKSITTRWNSVASSDPYVALYAGLWKNTSAITSITLSVPTGTLSAGFTFDLYGIRSGSASALGGDVTITDGNYWYHVFKSSGTFTPTSTLSCNVLVIGGGGGQGNYAGGGAGGVFYATAQSVSTAQTVTIGGGGSGGPTAGTDSTFGSLTPGKGGGVSGYTSVPQGGAGGSGGGSYTALSGGASNQSSTGGTGYGNAGGAGGTTAGGGGGGAGAAGSSSASGAFGGVGTSAFSSWGLATTTGENVSGTVYYAGGGNGQTAGGVAAASTGAYGGGGSTSREALANTGGGGGGLSGIAASGIVIVRYAV